MCFISFSLFYTSQIATFKSTYNITESPTKLKIAQIFGIFWKQFLKPFWIGVFQYDSLYCLKHCWFSLGMSETITLRSLPRLSSEGNDFCTYRCSLFSVTHSVDWIDCVKDSITSKETYNLTRYCILHPFYCNIFSSHSLFLDCHKIVHFLSRLHV